MNLVLLGKIIGTHGIKGEVKILSDSDFKSERFKIGNTLYLKQNNQNIPITINSYRVHKGLDLITFNDFKNINEVLPFVGLEIYVNYSNQESLKKDEYYYPDLLDCKVFDRNNTFLGLVSNLREVPQGTILEVNYEGKVSLVPFHREFVLEVDIENKKIVINPIEGLL